MFYGDRSTVFAAEMDGETTKILLVTANVGSIFEEPTQMFQPWLEAFLQEVRQKEPGVVALHCQEVGGKNYEDSMQHVNHFVKNLLACFELQRYDRARIFLDEDYTAADRFTALGNLYFFHEDVENVLIWDFVDCKFVAVDGREVQSGNIEKVPTKEKAKFPQHFFPEFKWSRKGFLRTRWSINNCIFDMVNIHLFHDASNIVAMECSPSLYCGNRRRALLHTLQRFENDQYSKVPLYIFGDFNFRLDSCLLIKALTSQAVAQQTLGKKDQVNKIVYTEEGNGKVVLTVETKSFDYHEKHADLFSNTIKWLLQYDTEVSGFPDRLYEYDINFPPSYPFTEDVNDGVSYMKTRVPSWCDRILLTHNARDIISPDTLQKPEYDVIGKDTCMGDHKPVALYFRMKTGQGNEPAENNTVVSSTNIIEIAARKRGLSINGEIVPERELDCINIHDFAVFEKEQDLIPEFRVSIKSRSSASSDGLSPPVVTPEAGEPGFLLAGPSAPRNGTSMGRTPSFKKIAQQVRMVERVLLRWPCRPRSRHHSSSSEDFCGDALEADSNTLVATAAKNSEAGGATESEVLSLDTTVSQLSSQDVNFELDTSTAGDGVETNSVSSSPPTSTTAETSDLHCVVTAAPFDEASGLHPAKTDSPAAEAYNSHSKTDPCSIGKEGNVPHQNSSFSAQSSIRDVNLNESKDAVSAHSEETAYNSPPDSIESPGVTVSSTDAGQKKKQKKKKPKESSKVVKSQVHPPASSSGKPQCCDRDSVVHETTSLTGGPRSEQVKGQATKPRGTREPGRCPCVIL